MSYRMAYRGPEYGLSAEISRKIAGKRDPQVEQEVLEWIETIIGERLPNAPYEEVLKDGIVLCKLMNKLVPGCIPKWNTGGGQFKLMENINKFQEMCKAYGVPEIDVFQTVDLWERRNIPQVTQCIFALGRTAQIHPEYKGPILGPKMSDENRRNFSEEQMRAGEGIINLQYGTNKGANQAGLSFGNTRHM
uniref:Calponin n=1 Tax=Strigamia maritima TaxID=126957 RepID=T1IU40_STRMM